MPEEKELVAEEATKKKSSKWKPGTSGNPKGRPKGTYDKKTRLAREIIAQSSEELTKLLVEKAKAGDMQAMKLCIERLVPPVKADKDGQPIIPISFVIDFSGKSDPANNNN